MNRIFKDGNLLRQFQRQKPYIMAFIELSNKNKIIKKKEKYIQDSSDPEIFKDAIVIEYDYPKIEGHIIGKYVKKFKNHTEFNDYLFQKFESWFTDYSIKEVWSLKESKLIKVNGLVVILEYNKIYKGKE